MYSILLFLHSIVRWLVLASLLIAIYRSYMGWLGNQPYSKSDNTLRVVTSSIAHTQLVLGLWLYFISPVIKYFLHNFSEAVHMREIRFFGMEHSLIMLVAIVFITIGSSVAKRKTDDKQKFKTMAIWFSLALLLILSSIPWPFSPMISRPYLRLP